MTSEPPSVTVTFVDEGPGISDTKIPGIPLGDQLLVPGSSTMDSFITGFRTNSLGGAKTNGFKMFLPGIRPEVAMTLVERGFSIPAAKAERNVEDALDPIRPAS